MAEVYLFDFQGKKVYPCSCHWLELCQSWPKLQQAFLNFNAIVLLKNTNVSMKYCLGNKSVEEKSGKETEYLATGQDQCLIGRKNVKVVLEGCCKQNYDDQFYHEDDFINQRLDDIACSSENLKSFENAGTEGRLIDAQLRAFGEKNRKHDGRTEIDFGGLLHSKSELNDGIRRVYSFVDLTVDTCDDDGGDDDDGDDDDDDDVDDDDDDDDDDGGDDDDDDDDSNDDSDKIQEEDDRMEGSNVSKNFLAYNHSDVIIISDDEYGEVSSSQDFAKEPDILICPLPKQHIESSRNSSNVAYDVTDFAITLEVSSDDCESDSLDSSDYIDANDGSNASDSSVVPIDDSGSIDSSDESDSVDANDGDDWVDGNDGSDSVDADDESGSIDANDGSNASDSSDGCDSTRDTDSTIARDSRHAIYKRDARNVIEIGDEMCRKSSVTQVNKSDRKVREKDSEIFTAEKRDDSESNWVKKQTECVAGERHGVEARDGRSHENQIMTMLDVIDQSTTRTSLNDSKETLSDKSFLTKKNTSMETELDSNKLRMGDEFVHPSDVEEYYKSLIEKLKISPCKVLLSPCYDKLQARPRTASIKSAKRDLTEYLCDNNELEKDSMNIDKEIPFRLISSFVESDEESNVSSFTVDLERIDESEEESFDNGYLLSGVDRIQSSSLSLVNRQNDDTVEASIRPSIDKNRKELVDSIGGFSDSIRDSADSIEAARCAIICSEPDECSKVYDVKSSKIDLAIRDYVNCDVNLGGTASKFPDLEERNVKHALNDGKYNCITNEKKENCDIVRNLGEQNLKAEEQPKDESKKLSFSSDFSGFADTLESNRGVKIVSEKAQIYKNKTNKFVEEYMHDSSELEQKKEMGILNNDVQFGIENGNCKSTTTDDDVRKLVRDCYIPISRAELGGYVRIHNVLIRSSKRKRKQRLFYDAEVSNIKRKRKRRVRKENKVIRHKLNARKKITKFTYNSLNHINKRIMNQNLLTSLLYWEEIFPSSSVGSF